jgi:hypothetical protein
VSKAASLQLLSVGTEMAARLGHGGRDPGKMSKLRAPATSLSRISGSLSAVPG